MAKDPAFLFYTGDFSTGTQFFSDEQVGIFMRLLMAQHQHGHLSEKHIKIICKRYDNDIKEILKKFAQDGDGNWYNERLEIEIFKRKSYIESRSNNRKSSSYAKKDMINISNSYVNHMENENKDENIIDNDTKIDSLKTINIPAKKNSKKFVVPDEIEIINYFVDKTKYNWTDSFAEQQAKSFNNYYTSNGWKVGKNPMKDWKAAASGWISRTEKNEFNTQKNGTNNNNTQRPTTAAERRKLEVERILRYAATGNPNPTNPTGN